MSPLLRPANPRHLRQVAVGFAADIVFEADIVAQLVNEARLPIPAVIFRIVNGDDVLELSGADPADALLRGHLVGMRSAGRVDEGLFVEAYGVDYQRIALEMADRVAVIKWEGGLLSHRGNRLVHGYDADLVVELVNDGDLPGRRLDDLERIRCGEHTRQAVGHAEFSGRVGDGAVFQARHVLFIGSLALGGQRQV